jgi:hypothetical protein
MLGRQNLRKKMRRRARFYLTPDGYSILLKKYVNFYSQITGQNLFNHYSQITGQNLLSLIAE